MFNVGRPSASSSSAAIPPPAGPAGHAGLECPPPSSPEFANHVLREGNRQALSDPQLRNLLETLVHATWTSHEQVADLHTAHTIRDVLCEALERSPAMVAAVSYGVAKQRDPIGDISYRSVYMLNPDAPGLLRSEHAIRHLTAERLRSSVMPIVPVNEAGYTSDGDEPYISIGAAPNAGSPHLPLWQLGLLHSFLHHVTGACFPSSDQDAAPGALDLLARQVLSDLGVEVPVFTGHTCTERLAALAARDSGALTEAAERHDHDQRFFSQLARISIQAELDSDTDNDSDDDDPTAPGTAGPSSTARTQPEAMASAASGSDATAYVETVLRVGAEQPISEVDLEIICEATADSVAQCAQNLADEHTVQAVGITLLSALHESQTMRAALGYAANHGYPAPQHISYLNRYRVNPDAPASLDYAGQIVDLNFSQVLEGGVSDVLITPLRMAYEDERGAPWVSTGAAPNFGSQEMSLWQFELLRLILSHLIDAQHQNHHEAGPSAAAMLAYSVCADLGWTMPSPRSETYAAALLTNDVVCLRESFGRHREDQANFLSRLARISQERSAHPGLAAEAPSGPYSREQ